MINDSMFKISVITPVYNDSLFLNRTINSVLNQTYKNLELIIIDDNSSDNSLSIIKSFKDERIKIIHNETNKGAAYSRNIGIKNASGDFIAFLDGDDYWFPTKLEKQLNFMIINKINFSYTNYFVFDFKEQKDVALVTGPKIVSHKDFMKTDYIGCLTAMYKKSIISDLQIPNSIRKRNDYALWLLISEKCSCYLLNEALASYSINNNGISSANKLLLLKHHWYLFHILYNYSSVKSWLLSLRNAVYYYIRKIKYFRKVS